MPVTAPSEFIYSPPACANWCATRNRVCRRYEKDPSRVFFFFFSLSLSFSRAAGSRGCISRACWPRDVTQHITRRVRSLGRALVCSGVERKAGKRDARMHLAGAACPGPVHKRVTCQPARSLALSLSLFLYLYLSISRSRSLSRPTARPTDGAFRRPACVHLRARLLREKHSGGGSARFFA